MKRYEQARIPAKRRFARLRPMARRSYGETGIPLPPVDDYWFIQRVDLKTGVTFLNLSTHHSRELPWDAIYNWVDDGDRGQRWP